MAKAPLSVERFTLSAIFEALDRSGVAQAVRPMTQGLGVIFCMHSVLPFEAATPGFSPNANLESTPEFLDAALSMLRGAGYEFLSLDAAAARIRSGTGGGRPFAVFTLDDGYRDNQQYALPVFARHACPFAIFATPGFVDGTTGMWWKALEAIIANSTSLDLEISGTHIRLETHGPGLKHQAWRRLAPLVQSMPELQQRDWIARHSERNGIDLKAMCRAAIMGWDELRQLAADPLVTIGAHTLNHYAVARLDEAQARWEIAESGNRISAELRMPVRHFAFPYGNVAHAGPRDFALCAEAGYETSVTTRLGSVFPEHARHMCALPRVMVSGKYQKARWLKVLASGLPGMVKNRGRHLNVA